MRFAHELVFASLPSTNLFLKENFKSLPNYAVVHAKEQTAGRGRLGRKWFSGDDLALSVLIKDALPLDELPKTALVAAAAAWKTIHPLLPVAIKWPNDIVNGDKKIAGILSETVIDSQKLVALIIGFGINVNTLEFPAELTEKATSLALATGKRQDIDSLKQALLENLDHYFRDFLEGGNEFIEIAHAHSSLIGKEVIFDDFKTRRRAKVLDILGNGNILLEIGEERREYSSGEITLKEIYRGEHA
ncbi:MAG: biotin--[acetyl-CoA-carboxylase] ligase [Bacilli bacterium]|jgi:BirA family biotin operon repressor/biotin-[acetyl-CoA-carboxylase] ligase|nr:biotin--[acetyl-CoA-carboxylase] ligase [Acholeplasmataceae bacterium]